MKFDRFRAYAESTGTRSKVARNEDGALIRDEDGNPTREVTKAWPTEEAVFSGKAAGGLATFDSGDMVITRVVFYAGPEDGERVVGSVAVNAAGAHSLACPD